MREILIFAKKLARNLKTCDVVRVERNETLNEANKMKNLFLIEFYTNDPQTGEGGYDINFAWVYADSKVTAKEKLATQQGARFDCVITCEQQAEIVPLAGEFRVNTPDANLFIIN